MSTLQVVLQNNAASGTVYAAITGTDSLQNALWLLRSDGMTGYYPTNPVTDQQPLHVDCNIALGGSGGSRTVSIPYLAGARIWFSYDGPLTFLLNQGADGPALVEPSPTNPSDPNYPLRWDFCELTYNQEQIFANISYVDFVCLPVALRLDVSDGSGPQVVAGMPANGLESVCQALQRQHQQDGADWDKLVVRAGPTATDSPYLRALSPSAGIATSPGLFRDYYAPYVDAVWQRYLTTPLLVDTQSGWGTATGQVSGGLLQFPGIGAFSEPAAVDIFSCSTGPFAASDSTPELGNITARLAAAFNRSTLLLDNSQPDGETVSSYYANSTTNHYARIVHATTVDGRGYAFPYDDVTPVNGLDQSGAVSSSRPARLTVYVGGLGSVGERPTPARPRISRISAREMARQNRQLVNGRRQRRSVTLPVASLLRQTSAGLASRSKKIIDVAADDRAAAQWGDLYQLRRAEKGGFTSTTKLDRGRDQRARSLQQLMRVAWSLLRVALPQSIAGPLARMATAARRALDVIDLSVSALETPGSVNVARVFAVAAGILVILGLARMVAHGPFF
ncbi:hypothetical protein SBRCBS47491_009843 [Sporothrix bragantina]|uniref:GH64 domain-containing protein n=1 Tax=Sporothrix bragantina TaxID=671064 RepID=A0ABP0D0T5_9PEZI